MINKVREEWNAKADVPMNDKPTLIHVDQAMLMFKLIYEELLEYRDAVKDNDLIEIADALGDMQFLIDGAVNQHGLQSKWDDIREEILRSNKTKLIYGKLIKRDDGKILKPDTYERPDLEAILQ